MQRDTFIKHKALREIDISCHNSDHIILNSKSGDSSEKINKQLADTGKIRINDFPTPSKEMSITSVIVYIPKSGFTRNGDCR